MKKKEGEGVPYRWTRDGILEFSWTQFESLDQLVLSPHLRQKLQDKVDHFLGAKEVFHSLFLPWHYGVFFYGPSGAGKTAAGKAVARALKWSHLTIPAHEILDSHCFEHALHDAVKNKEQVVVLEDVDLIIKKMEPEVFFTLLDHAMQRTEGVFWIANSRHPEETPKTQLLRPGRFDQSIRLELPSPELKYELFKSLFSKIKNGEVSEDVLKDWVERSHGLSYSHFEEVRQLIVQSELEGKSTEDLLLAVQAYVDDQVIAGDRWGGLSDQTEDLQERINQVDPRILTAALDMTDIFKVLLEKTLGDAVEKARTGSFEQTKDVK